MLSLLKKVFLKQEDLHTSYGKKKYGILCSVLGILLNLLMFAGKYAVGSISGSTAVIADAKNNLGDATTNIGTLFGFYMAGINGGDTHPGGHGRMEWLVSLVTSWFVFSLGMQQFSQAIRAIRSPSPARFSLLMLAVLLGSIAVKIYMWFYNRQSGKEIESLSMQAVAADCLTDAISTVVVCVSMFLEHFLNLRSDGWCGLLVSIFIMYAGLTALSESIITILGKGADEELRKQIGDLALSYPEVRGMHGLLVHDYGVGKKFVSFYVEGDERTDLLELQNEADLLAQEVYRKTDCECIVAIDIMITDPELLEPTKAKVKEKLEAFDEQMDLAELRMIRCRDHITVVAVVQAQANRGRQLEQVKGYLEREISAIDARFLPAVKTRSANARRYHRDKIKQWFKGLFHK